jgi:hypothetical protein
VSGARADSPGAALARAVAGGGTEVSLDTVLTTTFAFAAHRPRYTVRHLLKTAAVAGGPVRYVSEPSTAGDRSGATYTGTPESRFRPVPAEAELTDLAVEVAMPKGLTGDPALLATFVDHRVVVRLCTVENEALLRGTGDGLITGLLALPGRRRRDASGAPGDLDDELARAAAEVEETGGSCDGIVAHPEVYWRLVRTGMLGRLGEAGVRVSRTRMIEPHRVLLGDLRAAVTLLDRGVSVLSIDEDAGVIRAAQQVGLAVHLPQHLLELSLS